MSAVTKIADFFIKPLEPNRKYFDLNQKVTFCQSLSFRAVFVAQLIASIVALPILFLVGLFEGLVNLAKGQSCKTAFKPFAKCLKIHALLVIPTSVTGIFTTIATTEKVARSLTECLNLKN